MPLTDIVLGSEEEILAALAAAAFPKGKTLAAGGIETSKAALASLQSWPDAVRTGYQGLAATASLQCLASTGRPLHKLPPLQLAALLERWRQGPYPQRSALRLLLAPLKMVHFAAPKLYTKLGATFDYECPEVDDRPRYVQERSHDLRQEEEDLHLECDVVVVGTGAGGAVVAHGLASKGFAVIMVEEGDYYDRRHFNGRALSMQAQMYRDSGATIAAGNTLIPVPVGETVGGTTTINSGTCYRVPERVLAKWRGTFGLSELTEENLAEHFEAVESVLQVEDAKMRWVGGVGTVVARGCEALGYSKHGPLPRNAPDCDGRGICCFGCPTDAKRSTNVTYVPLALKAGAELFYKARVERIRCRGGRATGVEARAEDGRRLRISSRAVVLSCGALMTPVLLDQNDLCGGSKQLGRNLSIHPAQGSFGKFDESIKSYNAIPQGYGVEEFHDDGILFEGASTPVEFGMSALPLVGSELVELAENYDRLALFGFLIEDESRGRVRNVKGRPTITYRLGEAEIQKLRRGVHTVAKIFFAAGATEVYPLVHGFDRFSNIDDADAFLEAGLDARDFDLTAYHPLGTARMGANPKRSVVDQNHECHEVSRLYVVDGSAVPSSTSVNPQVTIMALASRAADRIADALS